jgi:hypothetical protein
VEFCVPEEKPDKPASSARRGPLAKLPTSALVVIVVAVVVLVWLLFLRGDDDSGDEGAGNGSQAGKTVEVVDAAALPGAVADTGYPVYWVGPRAGVQYEVVTLTEKGQTFVRYLPESEKAETKTPYLTVGSYRWDNAVQAIEGLATDNGGRTFDVDGGGIGFEAESRTSVYVAFPGTDTQIEVYDPEQGQARELVDAGVLIPVG